MTDKENSDNNVFPHCEEVDELYHLLDISNPHIETFLTLLNTALIQNLSHDTSNLLASISLPVGGVHPGLVHHLPFARRLQEYLAKKKYGTAVIEALLALNGHNSQLFLPLGGQCFPQVPHNQCEAIYSLDHDITTNPLITYLEKCSTACSSINRKMTYAFILTQIKEYCERKKSQHASDTTDSPLDDVQLLSPHLRVGSIILLTQHREAKDPIIKGDGPIDLKVGDPCLSQGHDHEKLLVQFTHCLIVTSTSPTIKVAQSNLDGVRELSLDEYIAGLKRSHMSILQPQNHIIGENIAHAACQSLGKAYDKMAPVAQFLGNMKLPFAGKISGNPEKTNCVTFIANAISDTVPGAAALYNKTHPNNLLEALNHGYSMTYMKTFDRTRRYDTTHYPTPRTHKK